ncbi:MAG: hydrogenase 1 maturation protease [Nitrospirae bacterium]|nr:MAG: hydrogenase 1 maturation protease [Nitrospirota bacterium]
MKIEVLGIGNILLRDEGVGVHAVNALKERYVFSADVDLIDGGTMGLDLLPFIEGKDKILIIDAADFGEKPGIIKTIEGKDIPAFLNTKFSVHQIGLPDMLFAANIMGITPPEICLVGIQPGDTGTGLKMSPEIKDKFQELVDIVADKLGKWGVEMKRKENVPCHTV